MPNAYEESLRRASVKAMLVRFDAGTLSLPSNALKTRREVFGAPKDRSEEGFQCRFMTRLCELNVLDKLIAHPTRTNYYVVRDSSRVLRALKNEEELTQLIWQRSSMDLGFDDTPVESATPMKSDGFQASKSMDAASMVNALAEHEPQESEEPTTGEIQATTLKVLAGMVDSLYYLRLKMEAMDSKMERLCKELGLTTPPPSPSVVVENPPKTTQQH